VFDLLVSIYPWTKALHVISVISWMAGIFYLPRLFVYHSEKPDGSDASEMLKVMERKLLRIIMNPAMIATWLFGVLLLLTPGVVDWGGDVWIYVKLAMVGVMTWFHHWLAKRYKDFRDGQNTRDQRVYRMMNEVPTLAMIVIVIMVIVKPF
jgi:protoporphyrinogen IX oxidase